MPPRKHVHRLTVVLVGAGLVLGLLGSNGRKDPQPGQPPGGGVMRRVQTVQQGEFT